MLAPYFFEIVVPLEAAVACEGGEARERKVGGVDFLGVARDTPEAERVLRVCARGAVCDAYLFLPRHSINGVTVKLGGRFIEVGEEDAVEDGVEGVIATYAHHQDARPLHEKVFPTPATCKVKDAGAR